MEQPINNELVAFVSERKLPRLSPRISGLLYQHKDDPDFWKLRTKPKDDSTRLITERDSRGRITKKVRAFADIEGSDKGSDYYRFAYEEWEYNDQDGTAVMKREGSDGNEYTRRTYKGGVMTEEVKATKYQDGSKVVEIIRPINQADGSVIYATEKYKPERVVSGVIQRDASANPSSQIELGSHQGRGQAVGLEDYYTEVHYHEYTRGLLDLKDQFDALGVPKSTAMWWTNGVKPEITVQNADFVVKSQFGEVTFPKQQNSDQVFQSLKF